MWIAGYRLNVAGIGIALGLRMYGLLSTNVNRLRRYLACISRAVKQLSSLRLRVSWWQFGLVVTRWSRSTVTVFRIRPKVRESLSQYIIGFSAATETHSVPAVIPRHYYVTFLNCNTHSGPSSGIAT